MIAQHCALRHSTGTCRDLWQASSEGSSRDSNIGERIALVGEALEAVQQDFRVIDRFDHLKASTKKSVS